MNFPQIKKEDLAFYHTNVDIIDKTAKQVIKDFATFGYEISFPENPLMAYSMLFDELVLIIQKILQTDISKLYSILYCIDINEIAINKCLTDMPDLPVHEAITHLVLERELKKVLVREYFKKNPLT